MVWRISESRDCLQPPKHPRLSRVIARESYLRSAPGLSVLSFEAAMAALAWNWEGLARLRTLVREALEVSPVVADSRSAPSQLQHNVFLQEMF